LKKCIIWANGKAPKKNVLFFLRKRNYNTLICADGGANAAYKLGIIPDVIIGDFDSISKETLTAFKNKSKIIQFKRQNDTDVEKCLKYAIKKKFTDAILVGVTGDRLDHTFCNLGIVIKFFDLIKLSIIAENSYLTAYTGKVEIKTQKNEIISLYGLNPKTKIKSYGLKYPLDNVALPFGQKESTSNEAMSDEVKLNISGGKIFVVRDFKVMKKNGFI
jgi:thiamine pyrophosphokinase